MPEISIVVPVYKVEPYLHRCIDSILSQTYPDFQLILVDDGSPDNCGAICDEYAEKDSRIHVIHQENGGLSAARNAGIDWVFDGHFTEWITFIDSDDWVTPNYLEELITIARQNDVYISIGHSQFAYGDDSVSECSYGEVTIISPEELWLKDQYLAPVAWAKLYKTKLFNQIRYPLGKLHEDEFTTYLLLFSQKRVAVSSARIYVYYYSPDSIMRSRWSIRCLDEIEAREEQLFFFKENGFRSAYIRADQLHMYSIISVINDIKKHDDAQNNMRFLRKRIGSYLVRLHNNKLFGNPAICHIYIAKIKLQLFLSGRWNGLKRSIKKGR